MEKTYVLEPSYTPGLIFVREGWFIPHKSKHGHKLHGDILELNCPAFTSQKKWRNWMRNHFPKREVERFITAASKEGRCEVRISPKFEH